MENDAKIRKGLAPTLIVHNTDGFRERRYHARLISYMNLQKRLKDTRFVRWGMLLRGLCKD